MNDNDGRPIDPATCGIDVMDGGDVLIVTRRKDALGTSEASDSCRTATVKIRGCLPVTPRRTSINLDLTTGRYAAVAEDAERRGDTRVVVSSSKPHRQ